MEFFEILLVLLYTALFSFIILRWKFFSAFNLSAKLVAVIFLCKIGAGILYGYLHQHLYGGGDTYAYFNESAIVFSTLKNDPGLYFRLVFWISYPNPAPDIVPYKDVMWFYTTPGSYLLVRFNSLVRLVSFGYYNVHVVFYNFLTLMGLLYLFSFFEKIIPRKKHLLIGVIFFFPSILFWSSGIHKDGISLAGLGLLLFFSKQIISSVKILHKQNFRNIIGLLIGFWLLLIVRNFWLMLLFPSLIAFAWTTKAPVYKLIKFIFVFIVYFGIATNLNAFEPDWDFLNLLAEKQNEFMSLASGNYSLPVYPLIPTLPDFAMQIPHAISNSLFQPWFTKVNSPLLLFPAMENIMVLLILVLALIFRKKKLLASEQSLLLLCLFFAFTIFIVLGITVPILGALVRYKMVGMMFLLISSVVLLKDEIVEIKFLRA